MSNRTEYLTEQENNVPNRRAKPIHAPDTALNGAWFATTGVGLQTAVKTVFPRVGAHLTTMPQVLDALSRKGHSMHPPTSLRPSLYGVRQMQISAAVLGQLPSAAAQAPQPVMEVDPLHPSHRPDGPGGFIKLALPVYPGTFDSVFIHFPYKDVELPDRTSEQINGPDVPAASTAGVAHGTLRSFFPHLQRRLSLLSAVRSL